MPDPTRAGRTPLRLVDSDVPEPGDPFAAPQFVFASTEPDAAEAVGPRLDYREPSARRFATGQSRRVDYSIPWTGTGLAVPPPPGADGDWPSDRWRAHLAGCGPVRACRHRVPEPAWWALMAGRGVPLHPDAGKARDLAQIAINKFQGHPVLPPDVLTFVQEAVRDALVVAPQPLTHAWLKQTLSTVTTLVRCTVADGGPLTRDHVFSERTRDRFLYVHLKNYSDRTVNVYRGRLDLVTMALNGVTVREPGEKPALRDSAPETPFSREEEATLYAWACGLRPDQRRKRTVAMIALGLGVGPRTPELLNLFREDVSVDAHGVHVRLVNTDGQVRVVTCRRDWEDRLLEVLDITPPGHSLVAPWRATAMSNGGFSMTVWRTQERFTPPVFFNARTLRNTWVVRLLESGTPLATVLAAADLQTGHSVQRLLAYCERQDVRAAAASLRGPVS